MARRTFHEADPRPGRLQRWVAALSVACAGSPGSVALLAGVLLALAAFYDVHGFAIDTNSAKLISPQVPWRQRDAAFDAAFPDRTDLIAVVVDGATPELAERASAEIARRIAARTDLFKTVRRPDGGPFFANNGLLFLSVDEVAQTTERLVAAQPLLGSLAADPSVRGLMNALLLALEGVHRGETTLASLQPALAALHKTLAGVSAGRSAPLSWQSLLGGDGATQARALRRFVVAQPRLDFGSVQPGEAATAFIRKSAQEAGFDAAHGVRVRLTGDVPMADEEFATLGENAVRNVAVMLIALLGMLWFAVRSWRAVLAIVATLVLGLAVSVAFGLALFGAFNLISVAFAVLFVGLGVDFGIQYAVAYRTVRARPEFEVEAEAEAEAEADADADADAGPVARVGADVEAGAAVAVGVGAYPEHEALALARAASLRTGAPLALAALAIAAGFFAFAPTDYRGVSELGVIAGTGMLIAFAASVSVLPALLRLLSVRGGEGEMGLRLFAPVDAWLMAHRRAVLLAAGIAALASLASLPWLRFDFNPLHLRRAATEAVATLNDLATDPRTSPNTIDVLAPTLAAAEQLAARLQALPEVEQALTLASFVPEQQAAKLAAIDDAALLVGPTLAPSAVQTAPTDAEDRQAMQATARALQDASASALALASTPASASVSRSASTAASTSASAWAPAAANASAAANRAAAEAARVGAALDALAQGPQDRRQAFASAVVPGLQTMLAQVDASLAARPVTLSNLPAELKREWVAADGRARVEVFPAHLAGSSPAAADENAALRRFVAAVRTVAPDAGGAPVSIQEAADTIVGAFVQAGFWAVLAVAVLLVAVLRRTADVLRTLASLLLGGLVTLGLSVALGIPLNHANIIALPLLFGIGVAFNIYFVMAWRRGQRNILQTSLARAVVFSALTTAAAFGSLWLSSHPGTSSMGKLLALSLACTLAAALFVLPAWLGPPPAQADADPAA